MKKLLIFSSLAAAALVSTAAAQTTDTPAAASEGQGFRAPIGGPRETAPRTPRPIDRSGAVGSVQRAARHGNPLQLLNPAAPAEKYGTAEENTTFDPNEPGKPKGFKLFAWVF